MQTAFIDLQQRLQHLTTFSSGLVLLGGKGASKQQSFLSEFVSDLDESVNIAFLNAAEIQQEQGFRQQLLTQLYGVVQCDPRRPLQQSISADTRTQGRTVIAVSQAGQLPPMLINELWDLSLHSDKLCILLAGNTDWALTTKQQLKGDVRPVLLQHDFSESTELALSDLDRLLAEKRQAFNARMAQRAQQEKPPEKHSGPVSSKVFRGAAVGVFLLSFVGLMHWFYPDLIGEILPADAIAMVQLPALSEESVPESDPVNSKQLSQHIEDQKPQSLTIAEPAEKKNKPVPRENQAEPEQSITQISTTQTVAQWSETIKQLNKPEIAEQQATDPASADTEEAPDSSAEIHSVQPEQDESETVAAQPDYAWDEQYLLTLPDSEYLLQLSAASDSRVLNDFIQRHGLNGENWRYQTRRYGGNWHVLLMQGSFRSLEQARSAASELPDAIRNGEPFAKTVAQVRKEISSQWQ
ncbi:SPOR domain-containing protein [Lacimicrobium alkaliphilum]|uniref:SPOR domain-containing protein n=1 Tax=Lacimicrobium alkaliphilum TaxID=1526571 RepID=A0ABQ1RMX5_9ALTE|nr:SPOR domain-containing protein [Lacimicrobium alkaliphilum]GGD73587.1 hypothetical protein GCM10011357_30820 [Lacimicrobium alkaliphilum]